MSEAPERIWAVHWNTEGAVLNGAWADTVRHFGGGVEYVRADFAGNHVTHWVELFETERNASADRITALEAENKRLRVALHAAINAPKGSVPACADEFYRPTHPALAQGEQP